MMNETVCYGPKFMEDGVVIFPQVMDRLPGDLGETHLDVLRDVQHGYMMQRAGGIFEDSITQEEYQLGISVDKKLAENNLLVRRRRYGGGLRAIPYIEDSQFETVFYDIANDLSMVKEAAKDEPDYELIAAEASVLEHGFRTGDTDHSMREFINRRKYSEQGIWAGLLDRGVHPLKLSLQAWSTIQDPASTYRFSNWSRTMLSSEGRNVYSDFIVCDAAGQAGQATERIWQGNTLPSQPSIGDQVGYLIYLFNNVVSWKTDTHVAPVLRDIAPDDVLQALERGGYERFSRAVIGGHEVGHAMHRIPAYADIRLGRFYQPLRELFADVFALVAVTKYPNIVMNREDTNPALYFDAALASVTVDTHNAQVAEGVQKRLGVDPYPLIRAAKYNILLEEGAISFDDSGKVRFAERDKVRKVAEKIIRHAQTLTDGGSPAQVEDYLMKHATNSSNALALAA